MPSKAGRRRPSPGRCTFPRPLPIDQDPLAFKHYLLLREFYGDPPYAEFGGLTAEQIAALVAEHERDPCQQDPDQAPEERK